MAPLSDRKAFEDAVWNLTTECERDMAVDPYPKGAKARQDALFAKVMEKYDQLTGDLESARDACNINAARYASDLAEVKAELVCYKVDKHELLDLTQHEHTKIIGLEIDRDALKRENERLTKALEFYANVNYQRYSPRMGIRLTHSDAESDSGRIAREALAASKKG